MVVPLIFVLAGVGLVVALKLRGRVPGSGLPAAAERASCGCGGDGCCGG